MDKSKYIPALGPDDPLSEISDYTLLMRDLLTPARAEFYNNGFDTEAGKDWDVGPLTLDSAASENNNFAKVGGLSGSIELTASGRFRVSCMVLCRSNPGDKFWLIRNDGTTVGADGGNNALWETNPVALSFTSTAGKLIRVTGRTTNAVRITSRLIIEKVS